MKFGEDPEPVYKSGKLGMFVNGRWATPGSREITDFNWDVAPLPTGPAPGGNWQFWGAYVINAKTADPAAAWKLVAELTSLEVQDKISSLGANIPSRTSQEAIDKFLTYTPPENNQAFVDGIQNNPVAEGPLWQGNWPEFDTATNDVVTQYMNGEITTDEYQSDDLQGRCTRVRVAVPAPARLRVLGSHRGPGPSAVGTPLLAELRRRRK